MTWRAAFDLVQPKGVDLEKQVPHHLAQNASLAIDPATKEFALRAPLNESRDVRDALTVLAPRLPDIAALLGIKGVGVASPQPGENFYALAKPNAKTVVFGVVGNSLVAASQAGRASGLASEATHTIPAKAAAVARLDALSTRNVPVGPTRTEVAATVPVGPSSLKVPAGTIWPVPLPRRATFVTPA